MKGYLDCWIGTATALFQQALAGEPQLAESLPKPLVPDSFGFAATIAGDLIGRFAVVLDGTILASPLLGEGTDQKAGCVLGKPNQGAENKPHDAEGAVGG